MPQIGCIITIFMLWAQVFHLMSQILVISWNVIQILSGITWNKVGHMSNSQKCLLQWISMLRTLALKLQIRWIITIFMIWANSTHFSFAQPNSFQPPQYDSSFKWNQVGHIISNRAWCNIFCVWHWHWCINKMIDSNIHHSSKGIPFAQQHSCILCVWYLHNKCLRLDVS